jgi:hypothetical protein
VPKEYDFEKAFNQTFGVIKQEPFEVEAEFTDWAAVYVGERNWGLDQSVSRHAGRLKIRFTASSVPEVTSWILSFGKNGRLAKLDWLVGEIAEVIQRMKALYGEKQSKRRRSGKRGARRGEEGSGQL